jgi:lysozyme family protein
MVDLMDDIINQVIQREGGSKATNKPNDPGGRTQYGISEKSNPEAWADGKVTEEEAREIYLKKYIKGPGFDKIPATHGRVQNLLIDYGVNSGPGVAIQKLQAILGLPEDGSFGPKTLEALVAADPTKVNNQLVAARVKMICKVVQKRPQQLSDLFGLVSRALEFLI